MFVKESGDHCEYQTSEFLKENNHTTKSKGNFIRSFQKHKKKRKQIFKTYRAIIFKSVHFFYSF